MREVHVVGPRAHPALEHHLLALRTTYALQLRRASLVAAEEVRLSAGSAHAARAGQRFVDANTLPTLEITPTPRRIHSVPSVPSHPEPRAGVGPVAAMDTMVTLPSPALAFPFEVPLITLAAMNPAPPPP